MMLLIDAGNSRLKWGLHTAGRWLGQGVLEYAALDTLPAIWPAKPRAALIANVAGEKVAGQLERLLQQAAIPAHFLRAGRQAGGVINGYRNPAQLGVDRWAALIGARALHDGGALVVCAGTATTIDMLDDTGIFRGGLILPGFDLMRASLSRGTAGLPYAEAAYTALPRSTDEAIITGCLAAQVGAIAHIWPQLAQQRNALCLLSGGAADLLFDVLNASGPGRLDHFIPNRVIPNLVLEGLAVIAAEGGGMVEVS